MGTRSSTSSGYTLEETKGGRREKTTTSPPTPHPVGHLAINSGYVSNFLKNLLHVEQTHPPHVRDKAGTAPPTRITMCVSYFLTKPLITQIIATNYI